MGILGNELSAPGTALMFGPFMPGTCSRTSKALPRGSIDRLKMHMIPSHSIAVAETRLGVAVLRHASKPDFRPEQGILSQKPRIPYSKAAGKDPALGSTEVWVIVITTD